MMSVESMFYSIICQGGYGKRVSIALDSSFVSKPRNGSISFWSISLAILAPFRITFVSIKKKAFPAFLASFMDLPKLPKPIGAQRNGVFHLQLGEAAVTVGRNFNGSSSLATKTRGR
jgi:hypothetical protein